MSTVAASGNLAPVGHQGARVDITQRPALAVSGWFGVLLLAVSAWGIWFSVKDDRGLLWLPIVVFALVATSLVIVPPGQTSVLQFFGTYVGRVRRAGFWWVLPLTVRRRVSVRVRNFETNRLKVNDANGNPVEIAAIVVWQVADTAKATYAVENYLNFVSVQVEAALRHVANSHPYDERDGEAPRPCEARPTLSPASSRSEVAAACRDRWSGDRGGTDVSTSRTRKRSPRPCCAGNRPTPLLPPAAGSSRVRSGWSSSPSTVCSAKRRRRAGRGTQGRMVSNLLVVLCGDQPPSPVVNAGSLYT